MEIDLLCIKWLPFPHLNVILSELLNKSLEAAF